MNALSCTLRLGVHGDPRLAEVPVIFGFGSYIPHPIPATFGYVYLLLRNEGNTAQRIQDVWLRTEKGQKVTQLDLPLEDLRAQVLTPGAQLALGFSRHLLTRCLRFGAGLAGEQIFTAHVVTPDGEETASAPLALNLDYPTQPLEDVELLSYAGFFLQRGERFQQEHERIQQQYGSLPRYADLHQHWGAHRQEDGSWLLHEYMPAAQKLWLSTDKIKFQRWAHHQYQPCGHGWWQLRLPPEALTHGTYMELRIMAPGVEGAARRVPALAQWVEQDALVPTQWCARLWCPDNPYQWQHARPATPLTFPRIYEAHVGMAQPALRHEDGTWIPRPPKSVGSFREFADLVLPRIADAGYTAVQLMGVPEHPLYKSFGYQVSGYFAPTSRCGTPDDFRYLVDSAHGLDLRVILDIPHSHSCPNTEQGMARYDGSPFLFSAKDNQWGTASFDYAQEITRRLLLSNCRYWMDEYRVDGFRFDAVGNMIYMDHGFGDDFSHVGRCFYTAEGEPRADEHGILYLELANALIHELSPVAVSIAEEFSGMPGMTTLPEHGGLGFDYRFAMGIPDYWAKFINAEKEGRELGYLWHEMTNHRGYEHTISYVECHDQSINGKDAMIWRLMGDIMYSGMGLEQESWAVSRGLALYKLMRLVTLSTAHCGYLNFMGGEFGHPEWLDDEGNAHRLWHLADAPDLKYQQLARFDRDTLRLLTETRAADLKAAPLLRLLHEEKRVLIFERGHTLLAFNFHELQSQTSLDVWVTPGKYTELCSSDAPLYGGHGNAHNPGLEHFTDSASGLNEQRVTLYLPPMTALVLVREA